MKQQPANKWIWYTIFCVVIWLPLSLFSKLGTDAIKKEAIASEIKTQSFSNVQFSQEKLDRINLNGDTAATGVMNLLTILGSVPVALALLAKRKFKIERNIKGAYFGLLAALLTMLGFVGIFFAYAAAPNATLVSVGTGLFPMVTVILAVLFLSERLTRMQIAGIGFAIVSIIIFSLT